MTKFDHHQTHSRPRPHFEPCALSFEPCPLELHFLSIPEFRFNSLPNQFAFTLHQLLNSNLRVHIPFLQFPRNGPNGVAIPLAQSEWLLEPQRQTAMKGWVRNGNCPSPRSLQAADEHQLLCERPFLKIRSSTSLPSPSLITTWLYKMTADSFFTQGLQNKNFNSFALALALHKTKSF